MLIPPAWIAIREPLTANPSHALIFGRRARRKKAIAQSMNPVLYGYGITTEVIAKGINKKPHFLFTSYLCPLKRTRADPTVINRAITP